MLRHLLQCRYKSVEADEGGREGWRMHLVLINMKRILGISSPTEVYKQLMSKPQLVSMRN